MTPTGGWCHAWSSSKNDKAVQGKRSAQNTSTNINQEEREQDQPGRLVERPAGQSIQQAKYLTSSYLYPGGTRREGGVSFLGNIGPMFSDHSGHWVSGVNIRIPYQWGPGQVWTTFFNPNKGAGTLPGAGDVVVIVSLSLVRARSRKVKLSSPQPPLRIIISII